MIILNRLLSTRFPFYFQKISCILLFITIVRSKFILYLYDERKTIDLSIETAGIKFIYYFNVVILRLLKTMHFPTPRIPTLKIAL